MFSKLMFSAVSAHSGMICILSLEIPQDSSIFYMTRRTENSFCDNQGKYTSLSHLRVLLI